MLSIGQDRTAGTPVPPQEGSADVPPKDSRHAPRRSAAEIPSIQGVRISPYRSEASLINISERGILAECGMRLPPGTEVTVVFSGSFTPSSVSGRVARTVIARMGPEGIRYHVGIAFTQNITLPELPAAAVSAQPEVPAADAIVEAASSAPPAEPPRLVNQW